MRFGVRRTDFWNRAAADDADPALGRDSRETLGSGFPVPGNRPASSISGNVSRLLDRTPNSLPLGRWPKTGAPARFDGSRRDSLRSPTRRAHFGRRAAADEADQRSLAIHVKHLVPGPVPRNRPCELDLGERLATARSNTNSLPLGRWLKIDAPGASTFRIRVGAIAHSARRLRAPSRS
jgi:hypothetical protein